MTGVDLVDRLTPTLEIRLGKEIVVGKRVRFRAGQVVLARLVHRDDFGSEIRVWIPEAPGAFALCAHRDLAGCELAEPVLA